MMNRTTIILVSLLAVAGLSHAQQYITSFSDERVQKNSTGWAFWFIPSKGVADTLSVKMSCVNEKMGTHAPHAHFEDELFYMAAGTAIVHLNGEEHVLKTGDAFYAPGNSSHSIRRTNPDEAIKYVMFKRETPGGLKVPFLPGVKEYTMKDCLVPFDESILTLDRGERTMCYLTNEMSGGLHVQLHILTHPTIQKGSEHSGQEVYFILEGKAKVSVNGETKVIEALSSCYCPANSTHSIQNEGEANLKYLQVRTN